MARAFEMALSVPWLITEPALQEILTIAERRNDGGLEALLAQRGEGLRGAQTIEVREGGVAVVPIVGPIFRYANLFTDLSGATSTQVLATDIAAAIADPTIRSIVLDINSPGGTAAGINELAEMIFAARMEGRKPIVAYAGGSMASAAYWIGAAAGEIVADATAMLGSIGAVLTIEDDRERREKQGVRTYQIVSTQSPNKRMDPAEEGSRAKLQQIVDDLAAVFVGSVARYRETTEAIVLRDFGQGGLFIGEAAVAAGLADRTGSLEAVIAELSEATSNRRSFMASPRGTQVQAKGPITVSTTEQLRAAAAEGHTLEEVSIAAVDTDAIKAAAAAEATAGHDAALTSARADGAKAERERIAKLQSIGMKGFESELATAIADGSSPEAFALKQTEAAKGRGVTVDGLRSGSPAPVQHGGEGGAPPEAEGTWGKITARLNGRRTK